MQDQLEAIRSAGPRASTFLNEVVAELKKVTWPTRQETYAATGVVVVVTAIAALYLGLVDMTLSYVMQAILS
jgi:preprotein translocase subunit SecE